MNSPVLSTSIGIPTSETTTASRFCPDGATPPAFPGLYVPHGLDQDGLYICSTYDAWLFTTLWTLIVYAAFFLAAAGYAFLVQVGASATGTAGSSSATSLQRDTISHEDTTVLNNGKSPSAKVSGLRAGSSGTGSGTVIRADKNVVGAITAAAAAGDRGMEGLVKGARRNWKLTLVVGIAYVVVGGVEAVLAGGIVGALLGTVYDAGGFRLSTWVPLVWAVINVLFLILGSFSIQERLL